MALTKERVVQALRDARDLMNDKGAHWLKNHMRGQNDNQELAYCSLGAVYKVSGADLDRIVEEGSLSSLKTGDLELRYAVVAALSEAIPYQERRYAGLKDGWERENTITFWNDTISRTWEDVNALFERAQELVPDEPQGAPPSERSVYRNDEKGERP